MDDWSLEEVEAIISDYFEMLAAELAGVPYNKKAHNRRVVEHLQGRSAGSVEFKHCNISAVLRDMGFPSIVGYKPRGNYQSLLYDRIAEHLSENRLLHELAAADADRPTVAPGVDDILGVLKPPPKPERAPGGAAEPAARPPIFVNYLEREARNRSLGTAGEQFVVEFERARLIRLKKSALADRIEHTARVRGDGEGFDVQSFEESGKPRLIEVKTTKYGELTPFFVSRNELAVSESRFEHYHLYRLFQFSRTPGLFILSGALSKSCALSAAIYHATVRPVGR